jgi:predicted TIM-barrel fold metal-dependent hydrolase
MSEKVIYNCHIHTLTANESPNKLLKNFVGGFIGGFASSLLRSKAIVRFLVKLLSRIKPDWDNDTLERYARFLETGSKETQKGIFEEIEKQYPPDTQFVVLAMDTTFAGLGNAKASVDDQHAELLALATEKQNVIPFYAIDPRQPDIVRKAQENLGKGKFLGVKIYPNLGYKPDDPKLMEVYKYCQREDVNVPVMSHCSPGGLWKFGLTEKDRRNFGRPQNYAPILKEFKDLRICLAHFGGDQEWEEHMKSRGDDAQKEIPWCRVIADMIRSGEYPNLYTDISYTLFMPRPHDEQVEYCDYLKVLLVDERIRTRVLFGSDFYMSRREQITEKELSIMLRSRLGEDSFFQIANINPKKYLYG